MSDSFWPHVLQHSRLPCPSLSPRVCSNSCAWVSVAIQLSHPLLPTSPPAFNLSEHHGLFQWVGTSHQGAIFIGVSASVFPMNIQGWFPLGLTGLISTLYKGFSAFQTRSDQISRSVMSDSLRPHELQHTRPPCLSPTPGVHWDSRPLSQWCHPAISSSVVPFSSCPQSLPASESFPMSQLFP